jgi:hypothetical protein
MILMAINGNKSEKLPGPLASDVAPVKASGKSAACSSTGMPELATGSKPVQSGPSRSNSAKYGKKWEKYGQNGKHNIT